MKSMAEGDQAQGGQQTGGGRTYSEEDVMTLMNETAKKAAAEALKTVKRQDHEEDDDQGISVINPRVVKQLKDTVSVFTALKELSSNPLQKTIEETVGGMAAAVVQNAFAPRGPPPKKDIVDTILNSQFAYGLGAGLGQRAPEVVESMGKTFGRDRAGDMVENIIGRYGSGQTKQANDGQSRQLGTGPSSYPTASTSNPSGSSTSEQKTDKQTEKELLLSLDPNNPEHVSAYAETQGGLPVDVARKMLMIHQDAFIEQMKRDGMNVDQISTQRGSHIQSQPSQAVTSAVPSTPKQSVQQQITMNPDIDVNIPDQPPSPIEDVEYEEYNEVRQPPSQRTGSTNTVGQQSIDNQNGQQTEMMKIFASDIGKVMGEMLNRIESINNTVFTLQNEMNTLKKQDIRHISQQSSEPISRPGYYTEPQILSQETSTIVADMPTRKHSIDIFDESTLDTFEESLVSEQTTKEPELETFEEQPTEFQSHTVLHTTNLTKPEIFFEGNVQDGRNFLKELEEESRKDIEKRGSQLSQTSVISSQQIPPLATGHIEQEVSTPPPSISSSQQAISQESIIEQSPVLMIEQKTSPEISQIEDTHTEGSGQLDKDIDNKQLNKDIDKFVTPIKKIGIHKKADTYKNISPSFKETDQENKEDESTK